MSVSAAAAASLARLLAWDAPFLPLVGSVTPIPGGASLEVGATGASVAQAMGWPRGQRAAVALQLLAAGTFLFDRGWHPSRALLRGCRIATGKAGPWLRLGELPLWRLEEPRLERRVRAAFGAGEGVLARTLGPLLRALLPERGSDLDRAAASRPTWEASAAWLGVLLEEGRDQVALRHPGGAGRALWARRFALPESGPAWVEEEAVLPGLVAATTLARLGRGVTVAAGAWEEEEVARAQARAAADGRDLVALTTLSCPGVAPLPLAGGTEAVWVLAESSELAFAHAGLAVEVGRKRPAFAAAALQNGARQGFLEAPRPLAVTREQEALASPVARRALSWLASAPAGLETEEVCVSRERPAAHCRKSSASALPSSAAGRGGPHGSTRPSIGRSSTPWPSVSARALPQARWRAHWRRATSRRCRRGATTVSLAVGRGKCWRWRARCRAPLRFGLRSQRRRSRWAVWRSRSRR